MKLLWDLYRTFFVIGAMTFGGGYAMLPILQREVVENKGWATEEELMDYFAIGQCTHHRTATCGPQVEGQKGIFLHSYVRLTGLTPTNLSVFLQKPSFKNDI